jgi:antitoxin VapB
MQTAKLFKNGRSQAVRLPKEFRFSGDDVYIKKYQGIVMLLPKESPWTSLVDSLDRFSSDYMNERNQPDQQQRASL